MDADNQTSGSRPSFCFHIETLISFWLSVSMETCNGLHSWKRGGGSVSSLGWRTTQTVYIKPTLQTLGSVFWIENSKRILSPTTCGTRAQLDLKHKARPADSDQPPNLILLNLSLLCLAPTNPVIGHGSGPDVLVSVKGWRSQYHSLISNNIYVSIKEEQILNKPLETLTKAQDSIYRFTAPLLTFGKHFDLHFLGLVLNVWMQDLEKSQGLCISKGTFFNYGP